MIYDTIISRNVDGSIYIFFGGMTTFAVFEVADSAVPGVANIHSIHACVTQWIHAVDGLAIDPVSSASGRSMPPSIPCSEPSDGFGADVGNIVGVVERQRSQRKPQNVVWMKTSALTRASPASR